MREITAGPTSRLNSPIGDLQASMLISYMKIWHQDLTSRFYISRSCGGTLTWGPQHGADCRDHAPQGGLVRSV